MKKINKQGEAPNISLSNDFWQYVIGVGAVLVWAGIIIEQLARSWQ